VASATWKLAGTSPQDIADGLVELFQKLGQDAAEIDTLRAAAAAWRNSNDVAQVAVFTARIFRRVLLKESLTAVLQGRVNGLSSARFKTKSLASAGSEVSIMIGPNTYLDQGTHRVVVTGQHARTSSARFGANGSDDPRGNGVIELRAENSLHAILTL